MSNRSEHKMPEVILQLSEDAQKPKRNNSKNDIDFPAATKSKILFACLFSKCIGNMMVQNIVSFLPLFVVNHEWDEGFEMNENDISFIIAVFSIAQILFSPLNTYIKNWMGAKNTMIFGFALMTAMSFGLGLIAEIKNPWTFFLIAVFLRFFQGMGDAVLQITAYSMITALYQDQMMKYIGYIEIAIGIGLGMGPTVGSVVYSYVNYDGTMYFFGVINLVGVLICFLLIPGSLNKTISK